MTIEIYIIVALCAFLFYHVKGKIDKASTILAKEKLTDAGLDEKYHESYLLLLIVTLSMFWVIALPITVGSFLAKLTSSKK